jgi:nicotinamidase/pyrazinamidase
MIAIEPTDVLVVVDMQYDFCPGGALGVAGGDALVPLINRLSRAFPRAVMTQDWHPPGHASFASSHPGAAPFSVTKMPYGDQVLWPDHCVQGTEGARLLAGLDLDNALAIVRKGMNPLVDSYSAFNEADGAPTGLAGLLAARGVKRVFACGLATDYCVGFSARDARAAGFETFMIEDACRGIDADGSMAKAWARLEAAGVKRIESAPLLAWKHAR